MESKSPRLDKAWQYYNQCVEDARAAIEATNRFTTHPEHRAQGYHSLMEAQSMAFNQIMAPRLNHPRVYTHTFWNTTLLSVGQNCGDCIYSLMALHGKQTYRVKARIGDIKIMLMQVYSHSMGTPHTKLLGNFDVSQFTANADGSIDIVFSATRHEGNWIPLAAESNYNYVLVRRFFVDWFDDMGDINIEMEGELAGYDEQDEVAMAERIEQAGRFITFNVTQNTIGLYNMYQKGAGGKNKLFYCPGKDIPDIIGSPSTCYVLAVADCAADEAVILEWDAPNSAYWGIQLADVWSKPLENTFSQSDMNMKRAAIDSDGKFRGVICHRDPGLQNWMELVGGRTEFTIVFRNYREVGGPVPAPTMKTVKLAELAQHLPKDTRTITPEQRRKDIEHRHQGNVHLYDTIISGGGKKPAK